MNERDLKPRHDQRISDAMAERATRERARKAMRPQQAKGLPKLPPDVAAALHAWRVADLDGGVSMADFHSLAAKMLTEQARLYFPDATKEQVRARRGDRRVTSPQPRRQEVRRAEGFAGLSYGKPIGHPDTATLQSRRKVARRLGPPDRRKP